MGFFSVILKDIKRFSYCGHCLNSINHHEHVPASEACPVKSSDYFLLTPNCGPSHDSRCTLKKNKFVPVIFIPIIGIQFISTTTIIVLRNHAKIRFFSHQISPYIFISFSGKYLYDKCNHQVLPNVYLIKGFLNGMSYGTFFINYAEAKHA